MAEESFALPGSSYKQLTKIIKAYAALGASSSPADVGNLAGTDATNVSRNNKFLVSIGIIEGTREKKSTDLGLALAKALEHEIAEEVALYWRKIAEASPFLQKIVAAVRVRRGMEQPSLISHIAYTAGAPKNASTAAGASAVLDILVGSGVLKDEGGIISIDLSQSVGAESLRATDNPLAEEQTAFDATKYRTMAGSFANPMPASGALFSEFPTFTIADKSEHRLSINLNISCTPEDLTSIAAKLKRLMESLNAPAGREILEKNNDTEPGD